MDWLSVLRQALQSERGVVVSVSDATLAKQQIYKARAEAPGEGLERLQLRSSLDNPNGEIWIVKGKE
jgi:hypothetical protein